jgi:Glycosyl hydrolases family 25
MTNRPYCIDIFHGNNVIDLPGKPLGGFDQVKAAGIAFLDHKASQGTDDRDTRCASRRAAWMVDGSIAVTDVDGTALLLPPRFGFYHFNGTGAAAAEAANFKAAVLAAGYAAGDDLCLDWEDIGASGHQNPAAWADDFCKATEDWCGFAIKFYGGDAPRQQLAKASASVVDNFLARRLWFCEYGTFNQKNLPLPWANSGPFQFQDDGDRYGPGPHVIPGISGYCDNSTVIGTMTVARLAAGWAGSSAAAA